MRTGSVAIHQRILSCILILQLLLPVGGLRAHAQEPKLSPAAQTPHPLTQAVLKATADPMLDYLMRTDVALPEAHFDFDNSDPVMDQDPFFLRSQRWVKNEATIPGNTYIRLDETGTLPVLELNQPFHEILRTDDFIFLSPNDDHYFDSKVLASEESQSQGVFFLHRETWQRSALNQAPTPLFFLPLHEGNWGSSARAFEMKEHDAVYFTDNQSPGLPIPLQELEVVAKAESLNLMMASSMSITGSLDKIKQSQNQKELIQSFLPPRGSTAGFGVVFTGRNLDNPKQKIELSARITSTIEKLLSKFNLVSPAHAEGFFSGKILERMVRVGVITGVSTVLSVILRSTVYRDFFARQREKEKLEGKKSSWIGRNTRYTLHVQAHAFLLLAQVSSSTFGNAVEYAADRYFPKIGAGEQTAMRKFFKNTVLLTRDNAQRVPVDFWTLMMGTGIVGSIDTLCVAYQTYVVSPNMIEWLGQEIPFLKERADAVNDIHNPNLGMIRRNDVIRNAIAYITAGASSYSAGTQSILRQELLPKVEEEMLKDGINPKDPNNDAIKTRRLTAVLEVAMKAKGLPGSDEFLFDYSSLYDSALSILGFKTEGTKNLVGAKRPGLTLSTLDLAIQRLKKRLKSSPNDPETIAALSVLSDTKKNISFIRSWFNRSLSQILKLGNVKDDCTGVTLAVLEAKKSLLSLTYAGDRTIDISNIPSTWVEKFGLEGARLASQTYRETFYDLLNGSKSRLEPGELSFNGEKQAIQNAEEELKARIGLSKDAEITEELKAKHQTELSFIQENEKLRLAALEEQAAAPYQAPKLGFFERYQLRRAVRKADEAYLTQYKEAFDAKLAGTEQMKNWQKLFSQSFANQVGLYPERLDSPEAVEETRKFIENEKSADYLKTLSAKDRATTIAAFQTAEEIKVYLNKTVYNTASQPLSTEQPGVTQSLRQKSFLKKSNFLSRIAVRALRTVDSLGSNMDYRTGVAAWIYRNVPFVYDLWKGMLLDLSALPTTLTMSYMWTKYLWNVDYPMSMWLFAALLHFTVSGPSRTLNRLFQNHGIKPMGSVGTTVFFSFIYSWATFFGFIPNQLFAGDFQKGWDYVGKLFTQICSSKLTGQ